MRLRLRVVTWVWFSGVFEGAYWLLALFLRSTFRTHADLKYVTRAAKFPWLQIVAWYKTLCSVFRKDESRLAEVFGRMNPGWCVTENKHWKQSSDSFFQKPLRDFLYQANICNPRRIFGPVRRLELFMCAEC